VSSITSRPMEYSGVTATKCSQFSKRLGGTRNSMYRKSFSMTHPRDSKAATVIRRTTRWLHGSRRKGQSENCGGGFAALMVRRMSCGVPSIIRRFPSIPSIHHGSLGGISMQSHAASACKAAAVYLPDLCQALVRFVAFLIRGAAFFASSSVSKPMTAVNLLPITCPT